MNQATDLKPKAAGEATRGEPFFLGYMLLLFTIVVLAFPIHAIMHFDRLPPMRSLLHVHALSMGAWYALAVVQAGLIARGNAQLHRRLGTVSVLVVLLMLTTGITVSVQNAQRTGVPDILAINSIASGFFVVFYSIALTMRRRAVWHKRFMAYAALALMGPAFGRVGYILNLGEGIVFLFVLVLMLSIPFYDWRTHGKVLKPTWAGLGLSLMMVVAIGVVFSQLRVSPS